MASLDGKGPVTNEHHVESIDERRAREEAHRWKAPVVLRGFVEQAGSIRAPASVATMDFVDRGPEVPRSPNANAFVSDNKIRCRQAEPIR